MVATLDDLGGVKIGSNCGTHALKGVHEDPRPLGLADHDPSSYFQMLNIPIHTQHKNIRHTKQGGSITPL